MADSDMSIMNLRYNQVTQGLEGFGGGSPSWTPLSVGGGGTPAGTNTQIQWNNNGAFGASANFTWTDSTLTLVTSPHNDYIKTGNNGQGFTFNTFTSPGTPSAQIVSTGDWYIISGDGGGEINIINTGSTNVSPTPTASYVNIYTFDGGGGLALNSNTTAPDPSSALDVVSTTRGALFPRMTTTQKNAISSPAEGLVVYDLTLHKLSVFTGSAWQTVTSS